MNFRYRIMQFMSGRYGVDSLFYVLLGISAAIAFINCFLRFGILQLVVYTLMIFALYRVFSRNHEMRLKENRAARELIDKLRRKAQTHRQRQLDKTHIYKKCPRCKAVLRLPRKKGKHTTVCPKCRNEFSVRVWK